VPQEAIPERGIFLGQLAVGDFLGGLGVRGNRHERKRPYQETTGTWQTKLHCSFLL